MRDEYDFSNATKNPYAKKLKKKISINVDEEVIEYFKNESANIGVPYQTLINLFLKDCADNKRKIQFSWK